MTKRNPLTLKDLFTFAQLASYAISTLRIGHESLDSAGDCQFPGHGLFLLFGLMCPDLPRREPLPLH
jgi:hypothetical protein